MPRDGNGIYSKAPGTTAVPNATIASAQFNSTIDDLVADANAARPISAGGTGAPNAITARANLGVALAQTTTTDATPLSGLIVGGFGVGGAGVSPGGDLDLAVVGGTYAVGAATTNTPSGSGPSGCACIVTRFDADNIQQIFVYRGTTANDVRLYIRQKRAGAWGAWLAATGLEGSTANGYYVKHPSGWMQCISSALTFTRSGNTLASVSWTFPAAFVASPQVRIRLDSLSTDSGDYTGDIGSYIEVGSLVYNRAASITTAVSLGLANISGSNWSSGAIANVYVSATGRWL